MRATKNFTLASGSVEKHAWQVICSIFSDGLSHGNGYFQFSAPYQEIKEKAKQRARDINWVYHNIPSSIAWYTEIHHDWKDGARMYLLTKGEHILRHRGEGK